MERRAPPPPALEADLLVPGLLHEIRHPLSGIKAGLQLLGASLGPRLTSLDEWGLVTDQVRRLEETLLTFQELADPSLDRAPALFAPEPVVLEALALLRFRLRPLGDRFALLVEGPVPAAQGSRRALLHAVTNLTVNALDAVEEAGGPARVEVRLGRDGHRPQVRVADAGPGIAPAVAGRLFEPRVTSKPPGKGTGLGLFVARGQMRASGGEVRLVPPGEPGRRPWATTEFAVELAAGEGP